MIADRDPAPWRLPLSDFRSVQSPLEFLPQHFNPIVRQVMRLALPVLLRVRLRPWLPVGIARVEARNVETLADLYQQFQARQVRFLIAFRHPEVDDPLCMFHLTSWELPRIMRQKKMGLKSPAHSYFIYERGMTLWAGNWLGWLFSRMGGSSIRRGSKLDWSGLKAARHLLANGKFPLAVAPEGATNGHSEIVSPLEPGVAQLGFWCVEDLRKAQRSEQVLILPIGIRYIYATPPWLQLNALFSKLERESGLPVQPFDARSEPVQQLYPRLIKLADHLLSVMEDFYQQFYHQSLPALSQGDRPEGVLQRLHRLLDKALQVSEARLGVSGSGSIIDRCRRLEEAGWNRIYREDLPDLTTLTPLQKGLANWAAEDATLALRHMRLVESFVAVTGLYVKQKPTPERFAETALLIFDVLARLKQQPYPARPRLGWRTAIVTVGTPISVSDRWPQYIRSRRHARQSVTDLTQEIYQSLQALAAQGFESSAIQD